MNIRNYSGSYYEGFIYYKIIFFLEIILLPYNTQDLTVNPPYFQVN